MTKEDIQLFCALHKITKYTIQNDLTVDVQEDVSFDQLYRLPFKFGTIEGHFQLQYGILTTLENCPHSVLGDFRCDHNNLTSLKGAPEFVGGSFACDHNQLTTLEYFPNFQRFLYMNHNSYVMGHNFFEMLHTIITRESYKMTQRTLIDEIISLLGNECMADYEIWILAKERIDTIQKIIND